MAKTFALILGIIIVLAGIVGFFPNPVLGAGAMIATDLVLNIVYIVLGVILVGASLRMPGQAGLWLKIVGAIYLILAVLGFVLVPNGGSILGLTTTNMAGHLFHAVIGVVLVVAGLVGKGGRAAPAPAPAMPPSNPPMGGAM